MIQDTPQSFIAQKARASSKHPREIGYPVSKAKSVGYARELEVAIAGPKEMHKRGIEIIPGGDYGFAWTPQGCVCLRIPN